MIPARVHGYFLSGLAWERSHSQWFAVVRWRNHLTRITVLDICFHHSVQTREPDPGSEVLFCFFTPWCLSWANRTTFSFRALGTTMPPLLPSPTVNSSSLFSSRKLFGVFQISCARLVKAFIVVSSCGVRL